MAELGGSHPPFAEDIFGGKYLGAESPSPLTTEKICQIVFHTVHKTLASLAHDFFVPLTVPLMCYYRL